MEKENLGSTEQEQEWILKYRATLDVTSGTESRMKAIVVVIKKFASIISFGIRSISKKRARTPANAVVCKQPAKAEIVPTTMQARRPRVKSTVAKQRPARSQPSPQRRDRGKAN